MQHVTIYKEKGRYAGWPANFGMWSWGGEIVLCFTSGYHKEADHLHSRDKTRPFQTMQARSFDGGESWEVMEMPVRTPGNRPLSADEHLEPELKVANALDGIHAPRPCPGDVDFTHPDFALMCARSGLAEGARSWFYVSHDRCRSWDGPYELPMFGLSGVAARTDYVVLGPKEALFFLTAAKQDGKEGNVFCARTRDGGRTFSFESWVAPEPEIGFHIMPASVALSDTRMLTAIRCRGESKEQNWIDLYGTEDGGKSWHYVNRPVVRTGRSGNPPTLNRLDDGRLCITYGYRDVPYGIRSRISSDDGETWSGEIILRDDGGSADIGYPRTVTSDRGRLATAYYYTDPGSSECYIAVTLWKP